MELPLPVCGAGWPTARGVGAEVFGAGDGEVVPLHGIAAADRLVRLVRRQAGHPWSAIT